MIFKKKMLLPGMSAAEQTTPLLDARHALHETPCTPRHTLVVFIGGAMDDVYGPLLHGVFMPYRARYGDSQDIAYATHGSRQALGELVRRWHKAGLKVVLVGHSWGCNTALRVARKMPQARIERLVTLDGVSRRWPGQVLRKPQNVRRWLNVYVDYREASMEYSNIIARLGGYWGHCPQADENICLSRDGEREITHAMAARMFVEVEGQVVGV